MTATKTIVRFESCVDSVDAAMASEAGGAARVELCADLEVGGTTPSRTLVERCVATVHIPVFVMVRPRDGSFVYSADEGRAMVRSVRALAAAGAHGVVIGALTADGAIDTPLMERLIAAARPLRVTCHKAIDEARDLPAALDALLTLGVDRVLTSGGAATAEAGAAAIADLVTRAGDALIVMAGGGVRVHNVAALVAATGVRELHARLLPSGANAASGGTAAWPTTIAAFVTALRAIPRG